MKKKGLIISTVVMVVVLIAALTTTTFAWFSATAEAKVDEITLGAQSATNVQIGVVKTPTTDPTSEDKPDLANIFSGDVTWASTQWQGASGLGSAISFTSGLESFAAMQKAVSIATAQMQGEAPQESVTIEKDKFFKAEGTGTDADGIDKTTLEKATSNTDYFEATFVVQAVKTDVKQIYLKIEVTGATPQTVGIAAAIHFAFYVDGKLIDVTKGTELKDGTLSSTNAHVSAFDQYKPDDNWGYSISGDEFTQSKVETRLGEATKDSNKEAVWTYYLPIADSPETSATSYSKENAHLVHVIAWIEGSDESCTNDTAGTSGKVSFTFMGETEKAKQFEYGREKAGE